MCEMFTSTILNRLFSDIDCQDGRHVSCECYDKYVSSQLVNFYL